MSTDFEFYYNDSNFVLLPNEPTEDERTEQRRLHTRMLWRSKFGDKAERRPLADRLYECRPNHRCHSSACIECNVAVKRCMTRLIDFFWPAPGQLTTFGLMIAKFHRPVGELSTVPVGDVVKAATDLFHEAGCADVPLIGCVDLCLAVDGDGRHPPHWVPHVHFITPRKYGIDLCSKLVPNLPKDTRTKRPCRGNSVQDRSIQISYVFKTSFVKDVRFTAETSKAHPTTQGLKPREEVEALLWLGRCRLLDRLVIKMPRRVSARATPRRDLRAGTAIAELRWLR